ncbi:hypothetical protein AVDCRST_MAG84-6607, partial [uncultured Microcoleus sp.]
CLRKPGFCLSLALVRSTFCKKNYQTFKLAEQSGIMRLFKINPIP